MSLWAKQDNYQEAQTSTDWENVPEKGKFAPYFIPYKKEA